MENQNKNSNRKVALYARVSTMDQNLGLESQVRALKEYCRLNNIENYEVFFDEGISGTKSSRPSLDRLMTLVKNNQVECVIVFSFSRFARSVTHLLEGLETFRKFNCGFISLSEKLDLNSSLGRAVFVIVGAIAQLERDIISERVKNGLANARAKGKLIGRKKQRDSILIRKLLQKGMSYRAIASIACTSHGSVAAEKRAMKLEFEARLREEAQASAAEAELLKSQDQIPSVDQLLTPELAPKKE
ncbi:MAG: recombinase family protein [Bdellovibrionaceae bacterium]|nr:recombinase family protein [Pseudobdellovibrionaceae bacterium]